MQSKFLHYIWICIFVNFILMLNIVMFAHYLWCKIVLQIIPNFYPLLADKVRAGIFSSLRQILEKRVLPTLFPLFEHPKLDRELRTMVREAFKEFCLPPTTEGSNFLLLNSSIKILTKFPQNLLHWRYSSVDFLTCSSWRWWFHCDFIFSAT